ncbi:hypothetical protein [Bradyrhizobium sp. BR 10289]|uniref:hypothetical protein n=1 Tax=Bradyrhizobium sp. BR 10289 TaxID=2749993 RepID=UPI001C64E565|nr:hypothetical protein [Bradyrhizobium sp. BR 10289]MBW7970991.1 hypothetical protein [Bradyrhizobium sp. BR 10289]
MMHTLYHGTSSVNLDSIRELGIVPGHAKGSDAYAKEHHMSVGSASEFLREPSVFVTTDLDYAKNFAELAVDEVGGDPVVITLHVPERSFASFKQDELSNEGHAWRAHRVAPSCVGEVIPVKKTEDYATTMSLMGLAELLGVKL